VSREGRAHLQDDCAAGSSGGEVMATERRKEWAARVNNGIEREGAGVDEGCRVRERSAEAV
jgi:hypothetical protein